MTSMEDEKKAALNILNGIANGSTDVEGDCYKWVKKYQHLLERLLSPTPPPVDGELAEADDKDCYVSPPLGQDKDFDAWEKLHDTDKYYTRALKTKLSSERAMHKAWRKRAEEAEAATSQKAREVTMEEIVKVVIDAYKAKGIADGSLDLVRVGFTMFTAEALAAKNIIRLKDGGGE